jgi:hypothetical protein
MSQLTITLSDKADALIAQLQKEIFNRRRKKVSAAGVIETLVESGAKSQSDKRFATSWSNLVADIEKAARVAHAHGAKPANLSDEEWALVLSHRTRAVAPAASSRRSAGRTRGAAVRRSANANRVAPIPDEADATSADEVVSKRRSTGPSKATAKSAAKPARTTRKASSSPAKVSAKTRASKPKDTKPKDTKPKATQPMATQSEANASQPTAAVAKATARSTGGSPSTRAPRRAARLANPTSVANPTSEGAAIPATAAAATPTTNRGKADSTTTSAARTRAARVSAATRMAKAVSRLGATTNPDPVAELPLVPLAVSANGSSPSPSELA